MITVACTCHDLPPHDHLAGHRPDANGVWGPYYSDYPTRLWVDWKTVAHDLMRTFDDRDTP